ncbi:legume-like lectin family protein [Stachybotrys elegans]|uniref:Legume-like lectin family protein n=1 Tax=Stachybotrys elegans TaxID=80388 RepID=A0A8K0SF71_9HYPO|nr:legume-like lectin family protein [Stachybotrys elegans]
MRVATSFSASLAVLGATLSHAQYLVNEQSFGYSGKLSPESNGKIPYFSIQGQPSTPEILSNKLVLTSVYPGNQRSAVWAEQPLGISSWIADVDFRANGPERGGGNLNIWLVRGGGNNIGSSSIYTVNRFDGLALVIDQHGGTGGMIRGFLNDNSIDYSQRHNIDELAFGHCQYSYRNLGRPSQIKLRQNANGFKVEIDGRLCFESDKISIPTGLHWGISAATPEQSDSFEIFKMVVMAETLQPREAVNANANTNNNAGMGTESPKEANPPKMSGSSPGKRVPDPMMDDSAFTEMIPDEDADIFQTSKAQFQDLHNRLQSTNHQLAAVYRTVNKHTQVDERRHKEIKDLVEGLRTEIQQIQQSNQISELQRKFASLEKEIRGMRNDLSNKIQANERSVKGVLSDHHATMSQTIVDSMPRHTSLVLMFVGFQVVLGVAYILYQRRVSAGPKKYL